MLSFETLVLWLHVAAVVAWVGGLAVVFLVCVPVLMRDAPSSKEIARLVGKVVHRFQRISWEMTSVILVTGIFNLIHVGAARGFELSVTYVGILGVKAVLFVMIATVQAWQSFRLVPAYVAFASGPQGTDASAPTEVKRFQRRILASSLFNLALAATAILLGLSLRYR